MYADDALLVKSFAPNAASVLNRDLQLIADWLVSCLLLNPTKFLSLLILLYNYLAFDFLRSSSTLFLLLSLLLGFLVYVNFSWSFEYHL